MISLAISIEELLAAAIAVVLLLGYHVFLRLSLRRDPNYTVQATSAMVRQRWVESVMRSGKDILAVQTLRNSTMAATFLASTSVVLVVGILNLAVQESAVAAVSGTKLLLMAIDLFIAFFQFTMAVRLYNHVGYMLAVPVEHGALGPAQVAVYLHRGAQYFSRGMRALYLLVPLVFWFFGAWAVVAASAALIPLLYSIDRAPRAGHASAGDSREASR